MPNKDVELELYQTQVQTNVSFTAFMTAVVVFFVGLLLTKFESYDLSIKIPISFLIISTFGFLYSTLIFANSSEEVSNKRVSNFRKYMFLGDVISEYVGVYLLIISIPLIINVITNDSYLRIITLVSSLLGLMIYQFSHFSVMERHFKGASHFLSLIIVLFGLFLFFAQLYTFYFVSISIVFLVFILTISYLAAKKKNP